MLTSGRPFPQGRQISKQNGEYIVGKSVSVLGKSLVLGVLAILGVSQASAADFKIGIVDMQKALAESQIGKQAQKRYAGEVERAQSKLNEKKDEYKKLQTSLEKQKDSLNDKAKAEKAEELMSIEKDLRRSYQDSQEQLRRKNDQIVGELVVKLRKIVDEYGRSEGYTFILERGAQSVLYADSSNDITDEVVKRFDAENK